MTELQVWCPKCLAAPGEACQISARIYQFHKKRRIAAQFGGRIVMQRLGIMMRHNADGTTTFVNMP